MTQPSVTILMPVCNGAAFLEEALASIWRQSFDDFELLVVDDGSTDATPEILAACRDPRLRVLRNSTRMKLSGALNRGLDVAKGTFVARMDADDLMRPDRLALQVAFLERHPEIVCCGGYARTFGGGSCRTLKFPQHPSAIRAFSLFYAPFAHPTVMFRRDLLKRKGLLYDGSYYPAEDYELWTRLLARHPADNIPRVLLDYRVHPGSMTGGEWSDMDAQTMRIQRKMLEELGLAPSEAESRLHRQASMGLLPPVESSFTETGVWLLKLRAANLARGCYEQQALDTMLNYVWYRMAMGAVRSGGRSVWRWYDQHKLTSVGSNAKRHRGMVYAAAWKAEITGVFT